MKIKISRMNGKPVEPSHAEAFKQAFAAKWDELTKDGRPTTEEGWAALNTALDTVENELRILYPCEKELNLRTASDFFKTMETYGPITIWKDESGETRLAIINEQ